MKNISLNGTWKYLADPGISFSYEKVIQLFRDKKISAEMHIPVNWQLGGLNNFSGSVWFIKTFKNQKQNGSLKILEFSGADYFTSVWFNGIYKGTHEGYFQKFFFDVSGNIKEENLLVVKVSSPREEPGKVWPDKKKLIKGIFNHHDCRPGGWSPEHGQDQNTGGIWNNVNLLCRNLVYVRYVKIITVLSPGYRKADVCVKIFFYKNPSLTDIREEIKITIESPSGKQFSFTRPAEFSDNKESLELSFPVNDPELWWSRDIGEPSLYKIKLENKRFGTVEETFGIREVKMDENKSFYLNGKKLFLRGTNIIPSQFLSDLDSRKIKQQVELLKDVNVNIVRMHAHVNRHEYYDELDKAGIMVWQDFALQWTYDDSDSFAENAAGQIRDMVEQFYNHPSIVFWCCHNEPGDQIKSLDPFLYEAIEKSDSNRIIRLASNYEEHPYDGWYWGNKEHFAACPMGPLVTEFGAQALPDYKSLKKFLTSGEINKPEWAKWKYHNFQYEQTFHIAKIPHTDNVKDFIKYSQEYQASLIRTAVDFYRREKFNKVSALFQFMFIDCWPSITWSVIDYYGIRKPGYFMLKKVFQPIYLSIKLMRDVYFEGQNLSLDIFLVNDLHKEYDSCNIEFILKEKKFASMEIKKIEENSVQHFRWDTNNIKLPAGIKPGRHNVILLLKDKRKKTISVNDIDIEIEKKIKV